MSTAEKSNLEAVIEALVKKEPIDPKLAEKIRKESSAKIRRTFETEVSLKLSVPSATMSEFVCDASVGLKWVVPEPLSAEANRLREDFRNGVHRLIAPDIFRIEVGHVLSKLHRQRTITAAEAEQALVEILTTCPDLRESLPLFPRAFELALQARCSLYDCFYVALSEQSGAPLVTADQRLINNLGSPSNIIHLASL